MIYFVYKCVVNNSVIKRSNTKQIKTMERNNNFEVALVKLACPVCDKEVEEQIIMNQKLTPKEAAKIKAMHGKSLVTPIKFAINVLNIKMKHYSLSKSYQKNLI